MELRVVSETASTLTLGWDPVAGAVGYRFSAEKQAKPSHTWDPSRSSVRFAKGSAWYRVEALAAADTGQYPPVPSSSPPLFDGRAARMTLLRGSTVTGNSDATQQPQNPQVWGDQGDPTTGLYFMGDDIRLEDDPVYGKVYRCEIGTGSRNPYWADSKSVSGELRTDRPLTLGQWDWYTDAFKIVSPVRSLNWHVFQQFGYPTLYSAPLGLDWTGDGNVNVHRHYGKIVGGVSTPTQFAERIPVYRLSEIVDRWVEYVIGVKWTQDATGEVHGLFRCQAIGETSFVEKATRTGTITQQWLDGQSVRSTVADKMGLYFGDGTEPFPTNTVVHRGFQRFDDKQSAIASFVGGGAA